MFFSVVLYLATFGISCFFLYIKERIPNSRKYFIVNWMFCILMLLCPTIMAAVRKDIGYDYSAYVRIYDLLKNCSVKDYINNYFSSYEPGYYLINRLAFCIYDSIHTTNFLSMLIILIFIYAAIKNFEHYSSMVFSLFIFYMAYYNASLNIIRQLLAMSVCLYAYKYIVRHNFLLYTIFILIGCTFHRTAIIALPFYFFIASQSKKVNFLKIGILITSCLLIPIIAPPLLKIASQIVYFQKYFDRYSISFNRGGIGFLLWILPVIVPLCIYYKDLIRTDSRLISLFCIYVLFIPLRYLAYYAWWLSRLSFYASVSEIVLVPILLASIRNQRSKKVLTVYYTFWYLFYYICMYIFNMRKDFTYPFISIWSKV